MAKNDYGVLAFADELEFKRFATFIANRARGGRAEVAKELGISTQTLWRLTANPSARVRVVTRAAIERLLAKSAGIRLTATSVPAVVAPPQAPRPPAKAVSSAALVAHLRDALLEAAAGCEDPSKLTKALAELL